MLESLDDLNIKRMKVESPEIPEERWFDVGRDITPEDTKGMAEDLTRNRNAKFWSGFAYHASSMRTLGLPVDLTPEDTKGMAEELTKDRNNEDWWSFADHASHMRILAADEVKMGGARGIEITDKKPKPKIAGEKPMPVRRKF